MAEMIEIIDHLATEIGPRPAATEEEQQAAFYIAERLEQDAGLAVEVEEFSGPISNKKSSLVCIGVSIVASLLALFLPVMAIPALVLTIASAALMIMDELGKPVLARFLDKGISQNVVARYVPESAAQNTSSRRRKIILVARYDSGLVRPEVNGGLLNMLPILNMASKIALVALPVLMLIKALFFLHATGPVAIVFAILVVIAIILAALPLIFAIMAKTSGYNDAANSNASGVAVMLEVARRINGADEFPPFIHGADEAAAADVIPEGASLSYEGVDAGFAGFAAGQVEEHTHDQMYGLEPQVPQPEAEGLMDAKAAIASMTGREMSPILPINPDAAPAPAEAPVQEVPAEQFAPAVPAAVAAGVAAGFVAGGAVSAAEGAAEAGVMLAQDEASAIEVPAYAAPAASDVPDWFAAGRAAAHKNGRVEEPAVVQKSRYCTALDAFEGREVVPAETFEPSVEGRLQQLQEAALEAKTVSYDRSLLEEMAVAEGAPAPVAMPVQEIAPEVAPAPVVDAPAQEAPAAEPEPFVMPVFEVPAPAPAPEPMPEPQAEEPEPDLSTLKSIPMDYFMAAAVDASAVDSLDDVQVTLADESAAPITLPDLGATVAMSAIDVTGQRAPLAQAAESGQGAAKSLLTMLPAIDPLAPEAPVDPRLTLPSLSGSLARISSPSAETAGQTAAFNFVAGATGTFAPVTNTLVLEAQGAEEDDLIVDDADDSAFDQDYTETGAYAGAGYVEMPKKRGLGGMFGRLFGKKKREEEVSTNDWLDVDDEFDARSVGAARGGWESFRNENDYDDYDEYQSYDEYEEDEWDGNDQALSYDPQGDEWDDYDDRGRWNGGAFSEKLSGVAAGVGGAASRVRDALPLGKKKAAAQEEPRSSRRSRMEEDIPQDNVYPDEFSDFDDYTSRGDTYGAEDAEERPHRKSSRSLSSVYDDLLSGLNIDYSAEVAESTQSVYEFRANGVETEVWFVALGAEHDCHAGIKSFIAEHAAELRGATIVELESMGAGQLCMINKAGVLRKSSPSSRMKRLLNKAASASGVSNDTAQILWAESAASTAQKSGQQALHLVGMDGIKPAYYGQADDTAENIELDKLEDNANFIVEMLKNV